MKPAFFHLLSIAPPGHVQIHSDLWGDIWLESSMVRCRYVSNQELLTQADLEWAAVVLVDCSNKSEAYAVLSQLSIPRNRLFLVSFTELSGGRIATPEGSQDVLSAFDVRARWREIFAAFIGPERVGQIKWSPDKSGDRSLKRMQGELGESLNSAVRAYFPDTDTTFHVEAVNGGLSGTPLLRISMGSEGYFVKFFSAEEEYIREWDKHLLAKMWLGQHTVDLLPVPELSPSGADQAVAFKSSASSRRYPICFHSAEVTATLKNLYPQTTAAFSLIAYTQVMEVLSGSQPTRTRRDIPLLELRDTAPGNASSGNGQTLLDSIRSDDFFEAMDIAISELFRYAKVNCPSFVEDLPKLQRLLHGTNPASLLRPASLYFGRSHGDANSRNFLFDGTKQQPSGLKIIDCGSYEGDAPLIFDLAQMESDLKIALMATEDSNTFGDIDTTSLSDWWEQESASLRDPFDFDLVVKDGPSQRAYTTIQGIRSKALELSGETADPRGYLFCLLYWTLRKLRRKDIPHAKRILALRSAARIAAKLHDWKSK